VGVVDVVTLFSQFVEILSRSTSIQKVKLQLDHAQKADKQASKTLCEAMLTLNLRTWEISVCSIKSH